MQILWEWAVVPLLRAGAGGSTFAAGGSGRSENFAGDPQGTVGFGV